ncbi:MAG: TonB-dependent receptor plug domain-containing protein [Luteitalea sp.]|nr:TonB-dependent receptor plug domain-containing protein [Luteitalea sp.]
MVRRAAVCRSARALCHRLVGTQRHYQSCTPGGAWHPRGRTKARRVGCPTAAARRAPQHKAVPVTREEEVTMKLFPCSALLLLLALSSPLLAQETTGTISGIVVDWQGLGIPGARVTVTGDRGLKEARTGADGQFRVPLLVPGTYTVHVRLLGLRTLERENVTVGLGETISLSLKMEVGGLVETIEVGGAPPGIDSSTTTVGANLAAELLRQVPVGRRLSDATYIAPGVSSGGGTGMANPSIAGGSGLENQYVVDGVNITNAGYGALGSYSILHGSLGNGVPFDFVREIQVKTGGYEAEYGQSTGGVVNVITKSGSNEVRGSAFAYFRPSALEGGYEPVESEVLAREESVNATATRLNDAGIELGGPLLENRMFFFGAIDPQWETDTLLAPEDAPLSELGEVDRDRRLVAYAAKATAQIANGHRADVSFFGDPATGDMGPQRRIALLRDDTTGFSELSYGGHNQTVKYDGALRPSWLVEASFARAANRIEETPSVDEWSITDRTGDVVRRSGGIGLYEGNDGESLQYSVKSTHYFANHEVRYGVLLEDIRYDNIIQRTGPTFTLPDGSQTVTGAQIDILPDPDLGQFYRVTRANTSNVRDTTQEYLNFFLQDTWRISNRLTVRPGIRYEQQKLVGNVAEFRWKDNWAPRVGGTFDVLGDGRSKLYANWGRFFAKIPNDLAARALSADAGVTLADYYDAALTEPIPNGVPVGVEGETEHFQPAGLEPSDFDPNSKSTYLDEALIGFEFEAAPGLMLDVRYIHRSFGRILEDVGTVPMAAYTLFPDEAGNSVEYFITNPGADTAVLFPELGASFEEAIHDYDAVELTAARRFAQNWQVQASYRWSRLYGTFEGFFRNDNGQSDPAITSLFDFPTDDPSYEEVMVPRGFRGDIRFLGEAGAGPLPNDRRHQFKLYGNRSFDWGLNLGLGVLLGSGRPLTALAANPRYQSTGEIPETPRGVGFQTDDGFKQRSPVEVDLNVHADYAIRVAGRRLVLLVDAFNFINRQGVLAYDDYTQTNPTTESPDFGNVLQYQTPSQIRFGIRYEF